MISALVVDDDASIRFVLSRALKDMGLDVTVVEDGAEVQEHLAKTAFGLVVIDLYMPGMNGFEVLRQLRKRAPGLLPAPRTPSNVPVLVVSGEVDPESAANARKLGADAQLAKPIDIAELETTVKSLLRRSTK